jgi:hypothetical protein
MQNMFDIYSECVYLKNVRTANLVHRMKGSILRVKLRYRTVTVWGTSNTSPSRKGHTFCVQTIIETLVTYKHCNKYVVCSSTEGRGDNVHLICMNWVSVISRAYNLQERCSLCCIGYMRRMYKICTIRVLADNCYTSIDYYGRRKSRSVTTPYTYYTFPRKL